MNPTEHGGNGDIEFRMDVDGRINFAMQQNDVPVVQALHIWNRTQKPLRDLTVRIRPEPEFGKVWETNIAEIREGSFFGFDTVDLALSPDYLHGLTERINGFLHFETTQGERVLARHAEPLVLLPRDEWPGLQSLPEILTAFVLPNHPLVEKLLQVTGKILGAWTQDRSLAGYQAQDAKRVLLITAAVYSTLLKLGLTYVNPPASFEMEGQRIRLPDRIASSRMATCLDLALLAAACLEQAGLNPLVVLVGGHAFTGVWLHDECFPEPMTDEPLRLRKRVDLREIAIFDPTCVTHRPAIDFNKAAREARRALDKHEDFVCLIDVKRARHGGVRPLPERVEPEPDPDAAEAEKSVPATPDLSRFRPSLKTTMILKKATEETPRTRLDQWCRKLLDLSLRNRLLNFKATKKTIPLLCPDLPGLENTL
ncbi:MAG: DUF4011 domain-containing protein, partial [Planctomycetota bacterium]